MQRRDVEAPVRHLFLMCIVVLMAGDELTAADQHGYELKQLHDETFPAVRPLAFGQIYTALERLAAKGFVELLETVRIDGPDRKVFRLTPAGRSELDRWLMEIDRPADFVVNPFAVKATLLLLLSGRDGAADYLRRQRAACIERMRQLKRRRSDPTVSTAEVLAADYEVAHLAADIEWMETASARAADLVAATRRRLRTTSATVDRHIVDRHTVDRHTVDRHIVGWCHVLHDETGRRPTSGDGARRTDHDHDHRAQRP